MRPHAGDRWQRPERGRTRSRRGRRRDTPLLPSGLQGRERINVSSHLLRASAALGAERDAQTQTRPDRCPRVGKSDVTESRAAAGMARRAGDLPGLDERIHGRQSGRDKSNSGRSVSRTRRGLRPREERRGRSTAASENGDSLRRVTSARAGAPRVHARRASCDLTLSCSAPSCEVGVLHARGSEAQELQDDAGHPKGTSKAVGTRPQHARPDSDTVTQ